MPGSDINAYQGNAGLGQGTTGGPGPIGVYDYKNTNDALDKFMLYQFYENRDKWARANLEKDQAAEQAANDLTFKLGDFLAPDNEAVLGKISEFNTFYGENPNAVKLQTDATGKIINGVEHSKWLTTRSEIDGMIAQANGRREKMNRLDAQIAGFTDPAKRKKAEAYREAMMATPIGTEINLYQDTIPWNPKDVETFDLTYDHAALLPNYVKSAAGALTDVQRSLANFQMQLHLPEKEDMRNMVTGMQDSWNKIIEKVKAEHPDVTNEADFENLVSKENGGDAVVEAYKNHNNFVGIVNDPAIQAYTHQDDLSGITLADGIDEKEMGLMIIANKLTRKEVTDYKYTGDRNTAHNAELDYAAQIRGLNEKAREFNNELDQHKEETGTKNPEALASSKTAVVMDLLTTPLRKDAPKNRLGMYNVPVTQALRNMFTLPLEGGELTIKQPTDGTDISGGFTEKKYSNYAINGIGVSPDPSGNLNNTTVTVEYASPDGKALGKDSKGKDIFNKRVTYTAQGAWAQGDYLYGAEGQLPSKIGSNSAMYLKKQYGQSTPNFDEILKNYKTSDEFNADADSYSVKGKSYTRATVLQAYNKNKLQGETLEQYIQRLNSVK